MKKKFWTVLLFADFALLIVSSINLGFSEGLSNALPISVPKWAAIAGTIVSLSLLLPVGKRYRRAAQEEDFDQFGTRKKDAKLKLSSGKRELVEAQTLAENERILSSTDLKAAVKKGSKNPERDLDALIGLDSVKEKVRQMQARMEFDEKSKKKKKSNAQAESQHLIFYGAPGTGKTTVARIITGLLYDYGYVSENKIVELDGNFLKASTAADTEKKVRMILAKAYGGVLFVDEAYALTQSRDPAGLQAIATLIKDMEDNRDRLVVIFAGYPNEMSDMLDANPGFRSRIKDYIEFPDYTDSDLDKIAISMAGEKNFAIDGETFEVLNERFGKERALPSWGNARTVRNVIEKSIDAHAYNFTRGFYPEEFRYKIMPPDVSPTPEVTI